jgi:hypothetical protein
MKTRILLAFAGLAISFVLPTFAQQKEPTLSEQDRQELDALATKYADAATFPQWDEGGGTVSIAFPTEVSSNSGLRNPFQIQRWGGLSHHTLFSNVLRCRKGF